MPRPCARLGRAVVLAVALVLPAACNESSPTGPTAQEVVLAPGETAAFPAGALRVRFDRVTGDSRCPADAVCILGGDAIVRIAILDGTSSREDELHTGSMAPVHYGTWTIALVNLSPYPFSGQPIDPATYRATLRLSR